MKQGKWNDAPCINFNMQTICEYVEKDVKNEPGKVYELEKRVQIIRRTHHISQIYSKFAENHICFLKAESFVCMKFCPKYCVFVYNV